MSVNALIFTEISGNYYGHSRAIGAYRIATEIRKAGYTCQVVNLFSKFSDKEMDKIMSSFIGEDTLIVGFSSTFFEYLDEKLDKYQKSVTGKETQQPGNHLWTLTYPRHADKMRVWINKMKEYNPKLKIVFGGAKSVHLQAICDTFAIGYCDQAIVSYMKFLQGKNPFFRYEKLNEQQILFYGDDNTSTFDFNNSTVEWHETDHLMHGEAVPIEIARGCIFKCKFCNYQLNGKKKLDYVKEDNVLKDEFLKNYYEHGITRYIYADDTHNDSIEKLERIHNIVTSLPFDIEYAAYLRLDLIHAHKETASLLKESGLRGVLFGIESLNYESVKAIGKGLHPDKVKETLCWLKEDIWKNDIGIGASFIVGLPYDTPETVKEWSSWVIKKDGPIDTFQFTPLHIIPPGNRGKEKIIFSEFALNSEKYGYKLSGSEWTNEYFTSESSRIMADNIMRTAEINERFRNGAFSSIILSNLGFIPEQIMCINSAPIHKQMRSLRFNYIDQYKRKLLKQINYEISI